MTQLVVPIMVRTFEQGLSDARSAAAKGADWVEFRIDCYTDHPRLLARLVEESVLPCMITCRPIWEGGFYDGDEQSRVSLLEHAGLGHRQPVYFDVELAAYEKSANIRQKIGLVIDRPGRPRGSSAGLILSSHDFESKPADLDRRVDAMVQTPACGAVKVAWRAERIEENVTAFEILHRCPKPAVALCMGEAGLPSRVLAKKFGALLTFAALDQASGTAPGQVTIDELRGRYRWEKLRRSTAVYGVLGWPVGHSLSPAVHNAGFDVVGYDGVYLPLPIEPGYESFTRAMDAWLGMSQLDFRGASVTIPHKANLLRYVEERAGRIEPLAKRIGAANTLSRLEDGSLLASNTDYAGALDAVCDGLKICRDDLAGRRVAVIGAGGAARAVVAGFAQYGATVVVYNRTLERARLLADEFSKVERVDQRVDGTRNGPPGKVVAARLEKLCDSCCEIYINCTPIGMHPEVDATPLPEAGSTKQWGEGTVVFDTVYNPLETRLLRDARQAGCVTVPGMEMFVRQAAIQFKQWTGCEAPVELFRRMVTESLSQ